MKTIYKYGCDSNFYIVLFATLHNVIVYDPQLKSVAIWNKKIIKNDKALA